jgi:vacuolar-type H+-ATPase subunit I/STV1
MKKVTIITPPEYESLILESMGKARVTQLKKVSGPGFEELLDGDQQYNYEELFGKVHSSYQKLQEMSKGELESALPSNEDLKRFHANPEKEINSVLGELEVLIQRLDEVKESRQQNREAIIAELQSSIEEETTNLEEVKENAYAISREIDGVRAKLESVRALNPEEFKSCFAVGLTQNDLIPKLEEYLKRYPSIFFKAVNAGPDKSFLFIFGPEEGRKWVEALFLVFEVEDVFDVLDSRDVLLVLDPKKRKEILKRYEEELEKAQKEKFDNDVGTVEGKIKAAEDAHSVKVAELKEKYALILEKYENETEEKIAEIQSEQSIGIGRISFIDKILRILSDKRAPVLRTNVISVIQGWVPDFNIDKLDKAIADVEASVGEKMYVTYEDPTSSDTNIPNPEPVMPAILQPTWILTKLRGWPSALELNPSYISLLVFSFQFGLMYGDIGQGAIFLILGLYLSKKATKGMMYRLGGLMIPMGISAIIFGFLYDSIFLVEHAISNQLHNMHIELPFHYPIMPNPVHETTTLMLLIFQIAMLEIVFGLVLGAINQIKMGNPIGALGEHGAGMILFVIGLFQTAMYFISIGMDFMASLQGPWFLVALAGMLLSFLEPVIHSVTHGHGVGMEAIGEGIAGLLMTFVEGLANMFSFLRIAAFALAHASLGLAAIALTDALGVAGAGLVIMNIIALSFEFISSTVQSLRLLYYEFMGKFFQGEGIPFKPYRVRRV